MKQSNSTRRAAAEGTASRTAQAVTPLTLKELFRGKSPKTWRAEYAEAFDWGQDIGREVIED